MEIYKITDKGCFVSSRYTEKDEIKRAGGKWSPAEKKWYFASLEALYHTSLKKHFEESVFEKFKLAEMELENLKKEETKEFSSFGKITLMKHQQRGLNISKKFNKFGLFFDCGTGKTITSLAIITEKKAKFIVIAPLSVLKTGWAKDAKNFPNLKIFSIISSVDTKGYYLEIAKKWGLEIPKKAKKAEIKNFLLHFCDVLLINPELARTKIEKLKKEHNFKGLIFDESSKIKNSKTKIFKSLKNLNFKYLYLLSGTPFENGLDAWTQANLINPYIFKNEWKFKNKYGYQDRFNGWHLKAGSRSDIIKEIKKISVFVGKHEVADLPKTTTNIRRIEETRLMLLVENEMLRDLTPSNALALEMKMRQASSGYYINDDGVVVKGENNKIGVLENLLIELKEQKIIIWTSFKQEVQDIKELLNKMNLSFAEYHGSKKNLEAFVDGEAQILIANQQSASYGTDGLQKVCSSAIYYSFSYSYEQMKQSRDRLDRIGQKHGISFYYLVSGIQEKILYAVNKKQKIADFIRENLR